MPRRPLPRSGGGGRGCGAERRQWRMQRGGAPAAVEKIEQASSAKIFSGTARRWGQMRLRLPWERICAQYGRCFASFVSSTASDRKGFVKGESVPLDPVLLPFAGAKGRPPRRAVLTKPFIRLRDAARRLQTIPHRAGVQVMPLQKAPRRRQGDYKFSLKFLLLLFLGEKQPLAGHEWRAKRDFAL